jgi:hypothetical protein
MGANLLRTRTRLAEEEYYRLMALAGQRRRNESI